MYPLDSSYYDLNDFGILSEEISYWLDNGFIPYIGGDYNSRLGDLGVLSQQSLKWRYDSNVDDTMNSHGRQLAGICELHNILPLNHCKYYDKTWDGKFTYHKAGKSSQIDFVLTNNQGRKQVLDFIINDTSWHLSDHLPLALHLSLPLQISMDMLLARAMELNNSFEPVTGIPSSRFTFNLNRACDMLLSRYATISDAFVEDSPDNIINVMDENVSAILKENKVKKEEDLKYEIEDFNAECDRLFKEYVIEVQKKNSNQNKIGNAYDKYQAARNKMNADVFNAHEEKYKNILQLGDEQKLWSEINWSGRYKDSPSQQIPIQIMSNYFEKLYQPLDKNEKDELETLSTETYIPITDDPITINELHLASKKMKKGGYDYSLDVLRLMMLCISPLLLMLFNLVFYVTYPIKFGMSILTTIPKAGNLKLLTNYRGIHMQNLLSLFYDRIITNRLTMWAKINPEQSAFQKGKSTLNHIFLLRVVTALTKHAKVPLFIGFFDLEKAFDKVSRPLLLRSLIRLGIGSSLFFAIKAMYSTTRCIIKSGKKLSDVFLTHSGIKQGAPSSVVLFIIFMDEFVDIVRNKCVREKVTELIHILLHADDTAVLSTDRSLFIKKCNVLLEAFKKKKVSLNLKKSAFMVINPQRTEDRHDIKLTSGWLEYRSTYTYLGAIFSDNGSVAVDVDLHVKQRQKSVFVKLSNYMRNNQTAPITVKRKILRSCLNASLLYGCETWGSASLQKVETLYRKAIKLTFGMRSNTPNAILFIESGLTELKAEIYKRQYEYWGKVQKSIDDDPYTEISKVLIKGIETNVHFVRHYKEMTTKFSNACECYNFFKETSKNKMKEDIVKKTQVHSFSVLDDYVRINPTFESPTFYHKYTICERERQLLTKYRSGSHYLKINTGYYQRTPIEARLCKCNEVQTLTHVLFQCPFTKAMRHGVFPDNLKDFFDNDMMAVSKLATMEAILKIRKF